MSHFLMAMDMLVDKLHDLTGIEAVLLAQVDEQTVEARSGFPASFLETTFFAITPSGTFSATVGRDLYFGTVTVIFSETVELMRHHAFNQVFLA